MINFLIKLRSLSERSDKIYLLILFILLLFSVVLEILGLALILPLISLMFENLEGLIDSQSKINRFLSIIPSPYLSIKNIFLFYFFRFLFLIVVVYIKNSFSNNFSSKITKRLYKSYLFMPYENLLKRDISSINKNLYAESYSINLYITSIISFLIDLITTITSSFNSNASFTTPSTILVLN